MSVQEKKKQNCAKEHLILFPCLTLKCHVLGLKITEIWNIFPCVHISKPEVLCSTIMSFKKELYCYELNLCHAERKRLDFDISLLKSLPLRRRKLHSWFGRDKPEKKSGLIFTLSTSWFICFIVYIFIVSF